MEEEKKEEYDERERERRRESRRERKRRRIKIPCHQVQLSFYKPLLLSS